MSPGEKPRSNIEIKARCADLALMRVLAVESGAEFAGEETQRDTCFRARKFRLKLRQRKGKDFQCAELIRYSRPNCSGPKLSEYTIRPVRRPRILGWWLSLRRGVEVEVYKHREIWLWRGVRIHLDEVEGLGTFIELEAVVKDIGSESAASLSCRQLFDFFKIDERDLLESSYADLIMAYNRAEELNN